jgi:hypothetical protein
MNPNKKLNFLLAIMIELIRCEFVRAKGRTLSPAMHKNMTQGVIGKFFIMRVLRLKIKGKQAFKASGFRP